MKSYYEKVQGDFYLNFLGRIHKILRPENYLEIGSQTGASLTPATCKTVSVDPVFQLKVDAIGNKPAVFFFQMTSDKFFSNYSPSVLFNSSIDFAFLDGLHLAEALLRDIINTEKHCKKNSIIALHDCMPGELKIATRADDINLREGAEKPTWWAGDVWKVIPILKKYRPDINLVALDCAPTGLILMTGLNPLSTVLEENYTQISHEMSNFGQEEFEKFWDELEITKESSLFSFEDISIHFWL